MKVHFIVETLKGYPLMFSRNSHTPWMHRQLYQDKMEPSVQVCFSISTLYSNVTDSNKSSVFKLLCQGPVDLKRLPETSIPRERLARTQALFLYQIMRLFDGDITLRSQAEKDMLLLEAWVGDLCKIRDNLESPHETGNTGPQISRNKPNSWEVSPRV